MLAHFVAVAVVAGGGGLAVGGNAGVSLSRRQVFLFSLSGLILFAGLRGGHCIQRLPADGVMIASGQFEMEEEDNVGEDRGGG